MVARLDGLHDSGTGRDKRRTGFGALQSPVQRLMDRLGQADRARIVVPDHLHLVHDVAETNVGLRVGEADRAASPPVSERAVLDHI